MKSVMLSAACVAGMLSIAACGDRRTDEANPAEMPSATTGVEGATGTSGTVTLADIAANPDRYAGQTVTVIADVEEVHGPRAFALDEDAPLAGGLDNDVLVLSKQSGSLSDIDDQWLNNKVKVTGKVGTWSLVEVEREVGWDLDPELEVELEGVKAVLIADKVERMSQQPKY